MTDGLVAQVLSALTRAVAAAKVDGADKWSAGNTQGANNKTSHIMSGIVDCIANPR